MNIRPVVWSAALFLPLLSVPAGADSHWSLRNRWEAAVAPASGDTQKLLWELTPRWDHSWESGARTRIIARARADRFDVLDGGRIGNELRSNLNRRIDLSGHLDVELREAFVDLPLGNHELRLGKQQIVWGQADGIKVLDVVNPQSFREFVLPDYEDSRIPLWSARLINIWDSFSLEWVWIPDTTYHEIPSPGAPFAFTSPLVRPPVPAGVPLILERLRKPSDPWRDGDGGVRLSAFLGGWDLTFSYLYHYLDTPAYRRIPQTDGRVRVKGELLRDHLIGFTASTAMSDFTLRTEIGYHDTSFFYTRTVSAGNQGLEVTEELAGVLGLDWAATGSLWLSAQAFLSAIPRPDNRLYRDRVERNWTLLTRYDTWHDTLRLEVTTIWNQNRRDGLVRPGARYQIDDHWSVRLGYDHFWGNRAGLYGEFERSSRWTAQIEADF